MISADAVQNGGNAAPKQQGIQLTERALTRIRVAMAKESVSPEEGGLASWNPGRRLLWSLIQHPV